ncbi:MAG: hypothetical protein ACK4WF_04820 [Candidatus Brocadiales bacterium]
MAYITRQPFWTGIIKRAFFPTYVSTREYLPTARVHLRRIQGPVQGAWKVSVPPLSGTKGWWRPPHYVDTPIPSVTLYLDSISFSFAQGKFARSGPTIRMAFLWTCSPY